ncbi:MULTISPECIES: putative acyl-CoA thioester hydrolase [unclassified Klebsiella]|uniref:putative acyl-CoA thioester hydrolase n=1 Tax=Enterobacteriaceae TaxID=543 RepID=UPI0015DC8D34|nr:MULTISPECIES: putative acyl-CoA thioester hydrolase [unclassified Klebsiella]HAT3953669.1 putative acyl-CoA thioester hydrolase [Kluyvera ascorbata]BBR59057.1 pectinesterase [Klebsiella sp. WP4-W18-ESBL-05]BBS91612.1 pectinesterase [Klebsiella sp. WP7-S18-CRE-02]BBS96634.1 pectinesterase [Klebsiella sp. WP7-S18-CRE-03]BBT01666.1 pectinesterase [Klebsiella sp. WP7-S18-ESBL-04]
MTRRPYLGMSTLLCMPLVLQGCAAASSTGTATRPLLTAQEAAPYTVENYFAQGGLSDRPQGPWRPAAITLENINTPWRVAPSGAPFTRIQPAIDAAIAQHQGTERLYIRIEPGVYVGTVYIPDDAPPITIFGAGNGPEAVRIEFAIDSQFSPATYRQTVNAEDYPPGSPAYYQYALCAGKTTAQIGTNCAAVFWSQSHDFQLVNLTIANSLLDTVDGGTHQGVALRTDGDRVQLKNMRLLGRQDTLYLNVSNRRNDALTDRIHRVYVQDSYIEGDVDYVFGRANAVFDRVHFHTVSSRKSPEAYVLAPNTLPDNPYGFLVKNSRFTTDEGYKGTFKARLGRAWDQGAGKTGYLPGKTANGQVLIVDSVIDGGYDRLSPWGAAATTARPFNGNAQPSRQLNDVNHNRLWEWNTRWQR